MSTSKIITTIIFALSIVSGMAKTSSEDVIKQLINNAHGGVDVHTIDGETSVSGYAGTGYYFYFDDENKLYLYPAIDINWGEYKARDGYSMKTTSLIIPVTLGYNIFSTDLIGMNIFGGVRYEQILHVTDSSYDTDINRSQVGLTTGATLRIAQKINLNASYYYGLTTLFEDGSGRVTSFNFSFNF